jgi:hypothetical protein
MAKQPCDGCGQSVNIGGGIANIWTLESNQTEGMTLELADGTEHFLCYDCIDSMEILLSHESVKQDMGRKRPRIGQCLRARCIDWSECARSRIVGVTARMPRAASGKARIGDFLFHAPASRSDNPCSLELTSTSSTHKWQ